MAVGVGDLTEQECASVTKARGRSRRTGARRKTCATGVAPLGTRLPTSSHRPSALRSQAGSRLSSAASGLVEHEQPRVKSLFGLPWNS